jgi:two-component system, NtrC family, response regulator GlrR
VLRMDRDLAGSLEVLRGVGIPLIGESAVFVGLLRSIERIARHSAATVFIHGETGTGKELIARAIHYLGARSDRPFVPVNCGALPESLAENELFGHRPGAFTGATSESMGLVRLAHRGTLFLDEVDSLPAKAQVALLRFLQDGHFRPLGAAKEERVDVRLIAASNRPLEDEICKGRFREDLFYRLHLIAINIPPLRDRTGDVHLLSQHFLQECSQRYQFPPKHLNEETWSWFEDYCWPGNVRELENLIHGECLLAEAEEIRIAPPRNFMKSTLPNLPRDADVSHLGYRAAKVRALADFDRTYLTQLIHRARGNVTKAAEMAGKERRSLGKLLKRYHIRYVVEGDSRRNADIGLPSPQNSPLR